ncbi:heterokaryon incompatibility domain-containing protein, partial [Trichoderma sp. SZMC 28013]
MAHQYTFTDLETTRHIRLLTLLPGEYDASLLCTISEFPLDQSPDYEALSYAWGAPDAPDEVRPSLSLNGQRFDISDTLEQALRRLRRPDIPRIMWIDRVCINQRNKDERNAQVAIMPDIYRGAMRVVAWIGERTQDSDRALLFLKEMAMHQKYTLRHTWIDGTRQGSDTSSECGEGRYISSTGGRGDLNDGESIEDPWQPYSLDLTEEEKLEMKNMTTSDMWNKIILNSKQRGHIVSGAPVLYDCVYDPFFENARQEDWEAVDNLLARPWWSRTWVVQEIWQAREAILQCGGSTLKWKTVEKAMNYQEGWDDMGCLVKRTKRWKIWASLKRRYGLAIHISQKRLLGSKLSDLLWNIWDRDATDPRDKVFAVLGLVGKEYNDTLPDIDYCKTMEQVYREAASFIMMKEKSLDLLLAASGPNHQESLPSWAPDWRREANEHRPALFVNASLMRIQCYFIGSTDALYLHGHGYSASGQLEPQISFCDDFSILNVHAMHLDTVTEVSTDLGNAPSAESIVQCAQSILDKPHHEETLQPEDAVDDRKLKRILTAGAFIDPNTLRTEDQVIENVMRLRRLFVTSNNHFCIGPSKIQVGDVVSIIVGCSLPIVIRPDGNCFKVVGEAYVHNYMAGEVLKDHPIGTSRWVDISL